MGRSAKFRKRPSRKERELRGLGGEVAEKTPQTHTGNEDTAMETTLEEEAFAFFTKSASTVAAKTKTVATPSAVDGGKKGRTETVAERRARLLSGRLGVATSAIGSGSSRIGKSKSVAGAAGKAADLKKRLGGGKGAGKQRKDYVDLLYGKQR
ncbi:hypothetical protein THASP1DRAFT_32421 [Thamnocephalis sphaerospora]|uniref:Uncharacterized protein n=1 Tax=Thamnocephalis sphaerospora TaxID=78915 RepID=A0A4P9XJ21_9FUNG|nr:hypothetical protein THASP1DRAFT_32421 [Thamnocephalis sphaerospora]|eukprot:RKP05743.1 hypothetical protein THASP1DRAFT_32421 [Thamnocephalis sphaerospora]